MVRQHTKWSLAPGKTSGPITLANDRRSWIRGKGQHKNKSPETKCQR